VPLKSVYDIQVNDEQFTRHLEALKKYQEAVAKLQDGWKTVGTTEAATRGDLMAMSGLLGAMFESITKVGDGAHKASRSFNSIVDHLTAANPIIGSVVKGAGALAGHFEHAARAVLSIKNIALGLVGAGGTLFGIDRLAESYAGAYRTALGLGTTATGMTAFDIGFGRTVDSGSFLAATSAALHDITQRTWLYNLGIGGAQGDTATVAAEALPRIWAKLRQWPSDQVAQAIAANRLPISLEEGTRLRGLTYQQMELEATENARVQQELAKRGLGPAQLTAWTDFQYKLKETGSVLWTTFGVTLAKLAEPLGHLSTALGNLIAAVGESPHLRQLLDKLGAGIESLAKNFDSDLPGWVDDVNWFFDEVVKVGKVLRSAFGFLEGLFGAAGTGGAPDAFGGPGGGGAVAGPGQGGDPGWDPRWGPPPAGNTPLARLWNMFRHALGLGGAPGGAGGGSSSHLDLSVPQGWSDFNLWWHHVWGRNASGARAGGPGDVARAAANMAPTVKALKAAGLSDAAVQVMLAGVLGEGGVGPDAWKPGDKGTSFGRWQLHRGGELDRYLASGGQPGNEYQQAMYVARRLEEIMPGFSKITDPGQGIGAMSRFEHSKQDVWYYAHELGAAGDILKAAEATLKEHAMPGSAAHRSPSPFPPDQLYNRRGEPYSHSLGTMSSVEKAHVASAMATIRKDTAAGKPWWDTTTDSKPYFPPSYDAPMHQSSNDVMVRKAPQVAIRVFNQTGSSAVVAAAQGGVVV
jgi:hypothetical protein